jgi:hypothetical protein
MRATAVSTAGVFLFATLLPFQECLRSFEVYAVDEHLSRAGEALATCRSYLWLRITWEVSVFQVQPWIVTRFESTYSITCRGNTANQDAARNHVLSFACSRE